MILLAIIVSIATVWFLSRLLSGPLKDRYDAAFREDPIMVGILAALGLIIGCAAVSFIAFLGIMLPFRLSH
jgi:hypothetical protein